MMKKITALIILAALFTPHFAFAQTNPAWITPQEITVTAKRTLDPALQASTDISAEGEWGKLLTGCQIGSRFIGLQAEEWVLKFWNVGSANSTKEEYGKASITITPVFSNNGKIRTRIFTREDGEESCQWEEASSPPPVVLPHIYTMEFSGGPDGLFKGVSNEGIRFTGYIENSKTVIFIWSTTKKEIPVRFTLTGSASESNWATDQTTFNKQNLKGKDNTNYIYENFAGGGFSDMYGQVEVNIPNEDGTYDEEKWEFAKLDGKTLPVGTHIKTSDKSGALISFEGQNTFQMGANSELIIAPNSNVPGPVGMLWGTLKADIKKMAKDGSMDIGMSQAVAGIKGTTFVLEDTKETSTIKVIEGSVSFKSKANGQTEMVNAGEKLLADKNGLGQKATFDVNSENASWKDLTDKVGETNNKLKNYLYFGIPAILLAIVATFFIFRKKKK